MNIKELSLNGSATYKPNEYLYNGKMMQDEMGLGWLDYGARFYDPCGRLGFTSIDPLAEDYYDLSPYSYCAGNPIACRDENGEWINFVIGAAVGAVTDYAVQVATNVASGQDFGEAMTNVSGKSIALAAGAGAMGVGIASGFSKLATVGKLATVASKSETAATVVKTAANVAGDATASVAGSVVQGKEVTVKGVVADVVGGAVAKKIETNVKTSAQNSPAGKTLQNQADRAQRVASGSNPRQSRVDNAKATTTKANNYGATKAFAAGTTGGNATSKAVEAATTVIKPEEKK
jgi:RHS repeat-associated protein